MDIKQANKLIPGSSRVRITNLDKFGFNGRDYPPTEADVGPTFTVIAVEHFPADDIGDDYVVVTVTVPGTPRVIQLIDHEITESC